jgi:hypothetical protein
MTDNLPALEYLLGTYFHQDFDLVDGGVWETVDAFVSEDPEDAQLLPSEIGNLLLTQPTEDDLKALFERFGSDFVPLPERGGYRGFLTQLAGRVAAEANG